MDEIITIRYHKIRALANQVIDRLNEETVKLGFAELIDTEVQLYPMSEQQSDNAA